MATGKQTNKEEYDVGKYPKCGNPMHETTFDNWEGDSDGGYPRYRTDYECLICGTE